MQFLPPIRCLAIALLASIASDGAEPTLDDFTPPSPNRRDEPLAESFSVDAATRFLDQASLDWTKNRKCFTCHTNYAYLVARPAVSAQNTAHREIRAALEQLVESRWATDGPRWDAEVVMTATLGNWQRADGQSQDVESSDGYATGFVIYVLRQAGVAAGHRQLQQGIDWLKANQRTSGRWYTRSLNKDSQHFISHAGSAFALLAIAACDPDRSVK